MIICYEEKIKSIIIPKISKIKNNIDDAYYECKKINANLPTTFSYNSSFKQISNDIYNISNNISKIENKLEEKLKQIQKIESKSKNSFNSFGTFFSNNFNSSKKTNITNLLKKVTSKATDISKTNAVVTQKTTSKFKQIIDDLFKKINIEEEKANDNEFGFDDFSDYQNIAIQYLEILQELDIDLGNDGKTINEVYEYLKSVGKVNEAENIKSKLIDTGFGEFKVMEIVSGKTGFDAIVLKDLEGNYLIQYPSTNVNEREDILLDAYKIFDYAFNEKQKEQLAYISKNIDALSHLDENHLYSLFANWFDIPNLKKITADGGLKQFLSFFQDYQAYYNAQVSQAQELSLKYAERAREENKTINIAGFSLGGTLAEESTLYLVENNFSKELGEIILYNPFHADLNAKEIEILKNNGNLNLYCAEGDMVSTLFYQEQFDDVAKYIYVDYKKEIDKDKKALIDIGGYVDSYGTIIDGILKSNFLGLSDKKLEGLKYISLAYSGGTHSLNPVFENKYISFNEDGSVKKEVELADGTKYIVDGVSYDEISKYAFGFNMKETLVGLTSGIDLDDVYKMVKSLDKIENTDSDIVKHWNHLKVSWYVFCMGVDIGVKYLDKKIESAVKWIENKIEDGYAKLKATGAKVVNKIKSGINWVGDKIEKGYEGLKNTGAKVVNKIKSGVNWVGDKIEKGYEVLKNTGAKVVNTIETGAEWVVDKAKDAYKTTKSVIKSCVKYVNPLNWF